MNNIKKLGFGFMRLPVLNDDFDYVEVNKMVDKYLSEGFSYFDTAFVYSQGKSEIAFRECVSKRYPRDSYQIANKMPIGTNFINEEKDIEETFKISCERCGVDYFDYYLLHALNEEKSAKADRLKAWDFGYKMKEEGSVKHFGFSFHDSAAVLDDILTNHPDVDFVQLQLNYYDWENPDVESRACYEVALKHNKKIIVMEPIKGGTLAILTKKADDLLKSFTDASAASWAIRYAASLNNILTVLSGMSNYEQLEDNVSYMKDFIPVTPHEVKTLFDVAKIIDETPTIPCTDCKYCVDDCPMQINIPNVFKVMNYHLKFDNGSKPSNMFAFENRIGDTKPSACIACGSCESHCPQKIEIIKHLEEIAKVYEN